MVESTAVDAVVAAADHGGERGGPPAGQGVAGGGQALPAGEPGLVVGGEADLGAVEFAVGVEPAGVGEGAGGAGGHVRAGGGGGGAGGCCGEGEAEGAVAARAPVPAAVAHGDLLRIGGDRHTGDEGAAAR
ncbi:hypothetical protein GCM10023237_03880 [Streptomyces coeruleoprunus]